ncbi:MAG: hypothetical protein U0V74_09580 [Chitinophagales bacterium]
MKMDPEIFNSLHSDLDVCRDYIRQISKSMVKGDVSKYPIFVAMRGEMDVDMGVPIINRNDFDISWSFNASHLEEFVNKNVVSAEKVEEFKRTYKSPDEYMCVFVAEEGAMSFVYMPFDKRLDLLN